MTMTKQHFLALAQVLKSARPDDDGLSGDLETWSTVVQRIADVCATSNAQFKRAAFWDACGYTAAYGRT